VDTVLAVDGYVPYSDAGQRRVIKELNAEVTSLNFTLSSQARESSRLRSELGKLQGSVEARLKRLTVAFDAFVELSDIRMTLTMFPSAALVRHRTRELLDALPGTPAPIGNPTDVPGYWLAPAGTALVALLKDAGDDGALAEATVRDPYRTALLLTFAGIIADRPELARRYLPTAIGTLAIGTPVTRAQRLLWTEAAAGRFGPPGEAIVRQLLAGLIGTGVEVDLFPGRPGDPVAAARKLNVLRTLLDRANPAAPMPVTAKAVPETTTAYATITPGTARAVPTAPALSAPATTSFATTVAPAQPAPAAGEPVDETIEAVAAMLGALVDEGTVEEAPLLRRSEELRAIIEDDRATPVESWDAPAGDPVELLVADASDPTPAGDLARAAAARWFLVAAEELNRTAHAEPPQSITVKPIGQEVQVTANGADLRAIRAEIERRNKPKEGPQWLPVTLAVAGLAVLVPSVIGLPDSFAVFGLVAGVALLIGAPVVHLKARGARATVLATRDNELRYADKRTGEAVDALRRTRDEYADAAARADDDLAAVRAHLAVAGR
jgi:hypothetical protein